MLAKLDGHHTTNAPTIFYCKESGYLISGEKVDLQTGYRPMQQVSDNKGGKVEAF